MSKRRVLSNLTVLLSTNMVTWIISTFYLALIARYLGPSRQGVLSLAGYVVAVGGLVVSLGLDTYVVRAVARAPERASTLAGAAILVRAALAVPVLMALYVYVHAAHLSPEQRTSVYILSAAMVLAGFGNALVATFQGREKMPLAAGGALVQNLLEVAFVAAVIALRGGVIAFAVTNLLMSVVLLALNLYWMRGELRLTWHVSRADVRDVVAGGLGFWLNSLLLTFYLYIDSVLLGTLAGPEAVGMYAPATRMFGVPLFLPGMVVAATLPVLSRLGINAPEDFARAGRKALTLLILSAVPLTIGTLTFAGPLIFTVYGRQYAPAVPVLCVLSLCIPWTFLATDFAKLTAARDQLWRWTIAMAAGCVLNPLLNLLLIPYADRHWHNAALGAAWSLLATEFLMVAYGIVILRDVVLHRTLARVAATALVAGAVQAAVLWATGFLWSPVSEALALVAYGSAALLLGALPRQDAELLRETAVGYLHRVRGRAA